MEISLRLDTLGVVEVRYLRGRERYRDWPQFQLLAASRQARVISYFPREVAEQLHQQILMIEAALGLDAGDDDDEDEDEEQPVQNHDEGEHEEATKSAERDGNSFSPAFAQALKQLNELARQRLPDATPSNQSHNELAPEMDADNDEDALEQLQDAFVQMMEVVRELAEEMSTDALKITGRLKCARTNIEFIPRAASTEEESDEDEEIENPLDLPRDDGLLSLDEVELVMVLQLFEDGRARPEDLPAIELQLDVDDFERLHETLDIALERDRRSRRRR
ncbi:hypothetical protein [Dictyobacter kobayashii]|uniref:Uncharacterized protein n=1 Tax=Dictyobacter kobayashii TaxID=2014872 RepID=A0A402ACL8_9CHLR|nr:hypothetical protein [Dictyobacter kobayashii]GCE16852.1 hypothetical protein KDK_06520 [Dictyobacter kobayashii]